MFWIILIIVIILFFSWMAGKLHDDEVDTMINRRTECESYLMEKGFNIDKRIDLNKTTRLYIDSKSRNVFFRDFENVDHSSGKMMRFSDITGAELHIDGEVAQRASIGGAIVGGVLAGGVGALIGSQRAAKGEGFCTSMFLKITFKDVLNPYMQVDIIKNTRTKRNTPTYQNILKEANRAIATFSAMKES